MALYNVHSFKTNDKVIKLIGEIKQWGYKVHSLQKEDVVKIS